MVFGFLKNGANRRFLIGIVRMGITKLVAAQQQLDCAIRLLLNEDELPSVISLSRAAFRVLYDLYPVLQPRGAYRTRLEGEIANTMGWATFDKLANQLKHVDNDSEAILDLNPVHAMTDIGLAVLLYHQGAGTYTMEMQAFESMMSMIDPVFAGRPDPTADGYADYNKAFQELKTPPTPSQWLLDAEHSNICEKIQR